MELDDELRLLIADESLRAGHFAEKLSNSACTRSSRNGIRKVISGVTSIEECMRVLFDTGVQ